jgi:hypothetical protein
MDFHRQTRSLYALATTWWIPGLPFAVGGPSKKMKGAPSLLESIEFWNAFSSLHVFSKAVSRETASSSPAGFGLAMMLRNRFFS